MTIEAKVIADSISPAGIRLTTFQLRYPRFIHSEFMTHRVFSRNASSSRAIPVAKMIEDLRRDPAIPVFWGSNKPGMQAGEELIGDDQLDVEGIWLGAMQDCIDAAELMIERGLHKQIANRLLEPWAHINVVVTATDYANFFALRAHKDAQPEMKALALAMFNALAGSHPTQLVPGMWHLPYVSFEEHDPLPSDRTREEQLDRLRKVSVARCARVSYLTHDGRATTVEEDIALYDRLVGSMPLHASPAEHQATPLVSLGAYGTEDDLTHVFRDEHLSGNLRGWCQYRKTLPGEFTPG